ncbi:MAG: hypothetical protein L6R42_006789 [Xanthoria sp. 1 TBL-2021]|nr:MAG: hypothetical protein L6R42_006789 [Xanthoria sp. 1 TBL-2021]
MTAEWLKQTGTEQPSRSKSKRHADKKRVFTTKWKDISGLGVYNETHSLRHAETKPYASIEHLDIPINWFLTATPVINTREGHLSGLRILRKSVKKAVKADRAAINWTTEQS